MIRILQATCESRLFFYIYPTPIPTLSLQPPKRLRLLITLNIHQCLLVSFWEHLSLSRTTFISVAYSIYLSSR